MRRLAAPSSRARSPWSLLLPLALAVTLLAACGDSGSDGDGDSNASASQRPADQPFVVLNSYEIASIDPVGSGGFWLYDFGGQENLLERTDDGELVPWAASSFERVDPLTWVVTVRDDLTYGNGKAVDAAGYAAAFNRQMDLRPASASLIPGGRAEASGDLEVTITTPEPNAGVAAALAERGAFPVYDVDTVVAADTDGDGKAENDRLVGTGYLTGPYQPTGWTATELTLERFEDYRLGTPPLASVVVRRVIDEQARMLALQSGEADLNLYPPVEANRLLGAQDGPRFVTSSLGMQGVTMDLNLTRPPFDQVEVRRAMALALDYRVLAEDVLDGVFDQATGAYPPGIVKGVVEPTRTDLDEAARLLDAAGWTRDGDGVRTKDGAELVVRILRAAQDPETNSLGIAIQDMVRPLGIKVELVANEDYMTALEDLTGWDATIFLTGLMSSNGAPYGPFFNKLHRDGPNNNGQIDDAELNALYGELLRADGDAETLRILDRASEIVVQEQAYLIVTTFKRYPVVVGPDFPDYQASNFRRHVTFDTAPR